MKRLPDLSIDGEQFDIPLTWEPSLTFLRYAIAAQSGGAIAFLIALRILAPEQVIRALGATFLCLVAVIGWYLLSRGRMRATVFVLAYGVWVVVTGIAGFTGGVRAPMMVVYPVLILMIGWMVSRRAAQLVAGLTCAVICGLVVAETWGVLPALQPSPVALYGVVQIILCVLSVGLVGRLVSSYQNRIKDLNKVSAVLAHRSASLEDRQKDLNRAQAVGNVGSWIYDISRDTMNLSAETCRIFGLPVGTSGNRESYLSRAHLEDRSAIEHAWQQALEGAAFDHEHRILIKGEIHWIRQQAGFEFAADGTPLRAVGVTQDITVRKAAEDELKKAVAFGESLSEAMPLPVFHKDASGRYTGCNSAFTRFIGKDRSDIIGKTVFEVAPQNFAKTYRDKDLDLLNDPVGTQTYEACVAHADNSVRAIIFHKARLTDGAGNPTGIVGVMTDITAQRQAEQRQRIAAIAFESQEGMVVSDAADVILRVNSAFTEITGYAAEEAVGRKTNLLKSGRHDAAFYARMWEALNLHGVWQGEIWNRRKDGRLYLEWLTITAVKGATGEITHYVSTLTDITLRKEAEDEINHLAFYDPLTHLPNRRLLLDRLHQTMAALSRSRCQGALLFIDLDNFKTLNDTLGHAVGDLLLQQVAQRLGSCIREGDTVARLGGDEFVVLLQDLSENPQEAARQTEGVGEKILAACNQPYLLAGRSCHSTPSIGATLFNNHQDSVDELLKRADLAMYQAKTSGRNTLRFFDPEMQATVTARATLESDLRHGLQQSEFRLYYQPQVDLAGLITGAEALLRWRHPRRGLVLPNEFITLAEETGLILPLGLWVLENACRQLVVWAAQSISAHLTLAVNISARQFRRPDFVAQVLEVLDSTGADPRKLKLELTESMLLDDVEDVIGKMSALKAVGLGFSLDDFGTGYSSLSYLKRLPLDQLKIDQGFVRDILVDANDAAIARTIVALAKSMGLAVIAEGVESEAQRDVLAASGCQAFQGYLFGRPLPLAEFDALQRER